MSNLVFKLLTHVSPLNDFSFRRNRVEFFFLIPQRLEFKNSSPATDPNLKILSSFVGGKDIRSPSRPRRSCLAPGSQPNPSAKSAPKDRDGSL
ncbi:hypothetical protein CEXT_292621 [Caerostris extrusa]|uniref:Uncharacterized protein n=1 Tax=Caerostris extrusa TaxID=172846 RepID=A0AAV4WAP5_CAEEX|nr:hypothetical protein CEXT_292621 [Caerostris extrusa]